MYATGSSALSASINFSPTKDDETSLSPRANSSRSKVGGHDFHLAFRNRPLLARLAQPTQQFVAAELLAPPVFLHDEKTRRFHPLVRGKAMLATRVQALSTPANDGFVVARIDDARLALAAGRTDQRCVLLGPYLVGSHIIRLLSVGNAKRTAFGGPSRGSCSAGC